jgi:hypothetical protein
VVVFGGRNETGTRPAHVSATTTMPASPRQDVSAVARTAPKPPDAGVPDVKVTARATRTRPAATVSPPGRAVTAAAAPGAPRSHPREAAPTKPPRVAPPTPSPAPRVARDSGAPPAPPRTRTAPDASLPKRDRARPAIPRPKMKLDDDPYGKAKGGL